MIEEKPQEDQEITQSPSLHYIMRSETSSFGQGLAAILDGLVETSKRNAINQPMQEESESKRIKLGPQEPCKIENIT